MTFSDGIFLGIQQLYSAGEGDGVEVSYAKDVKVYSNRTVEGVWVLIRTIYALPYSSSSKHLVSIMIAVLTTTSNETYEFRS